MKVWRTGGEKLSGAWDEDAVGKGRSPTTLIVGLRIGRLC